MELESEYKIGIVPYPANPKRGNKIDLKFYFLGQLNSELIPILKKSFLQCFFRRKKFLIFTELTFRLVHCCSTFVFLIFRDVIYLRVEYQATYL